MTGPRIIRRTVVILDTYRCTLTIKDIEDMYRSAFGWQMPTADVAAACLRQSGYISEQEYRSILNTMKGVVVNG